MASSKNHTVSIKEYPIPSSYLLENELLGMLICNPDYINTARKRITRDSFADDSNGSIWTALTRMEDAGEEITVGKVYSSVNGKHFQANIMKHCQGTVTMSEAYDKMNAVYQVDLRRRAYFAAAKMLTAVTTGTAADALNIASEWAESMQDEAGGDDTRKICDAINDYATILESRQKERESGKPLRVPTSLPKLDFLTYGGFANGNLIILAARPSVGKTAIMLQMARVAAGEGIPAVVFSLEMTNGELIQRMIRSCSTINGYQLAMGYVDWARFEEATGKFADLPLWLNDKAHYFDEICDEIKAAAKAGRCGIAFIDYLGLMSFRNEGASLYQQITAATKKLKIVAKAAGIPIVLLCQLNRDNTREGRAPELHDLRDSGSIEQDADIVLMADREISEDAEVAHNIRLFVRKNRQGQAGNCIRLQADDSFCNFFEIGEA